MSETEIWKCYSIGFEDERRAYKSRNEDRFQTLEKTKKYFFLQAFSSTQHCQHSISPKEPILDFWTSCLYTFKPLSLW